MARTTRTVRRYRRAALALALATGLTGACSGGGDDEAATGEDGGALVENDVATPTAAGAARLSTAGGTTGGGAGGSADEASVAPALPKGLGADRVVKTATLEVEVAEDGFASAFSKVPGIAAANGGFVASSSSSQSGDDRRQSAGSLVVRVPAEQFEEAREQLAGLGDLRSQQLKGDEVGGQLTDLDARLRNLRSHEEAIRTLMTKTGTIGETIEVQRQLTTVREQIEQLAAEQARLNDAVALSTITLSLAEPGVVVGPAEDGSPLGDALARAVEGTENVLAALIVTLGYLVPLGVLAGAVWLVVRQVGGRRRPETAPTA